MNNKLTFEQEEVIKALNSVKGLEPISNVKTNRNYDETIISYEDTASENFDFDEYHSFEDFQELHIAVKEIRDNVYNALRPLLKKYNAYPEDNYIKDTIRLFYYGDSCAVTIIYRHLDSNTIGFWVEVYDLEGLRFQYGYGKKEETETFIEPDLRLVKKLKNIFIRQGEHSLDAEDMAEGCAEELTYYMNEGDFNGVEDVLYEYGLDLDYVEDLIL